MKKEIERKMGHLKGGKPEGLLFLDMDDVIIPPNHILLQKIAHALRRRIPSKDELLCRPNVKWPVSFPESFRSEIEIYAMMFFLAIFSPGAIDLVTDESVYPGHDPLLLKRLISHPQVFIITRLPAVFGKVRERALRKKYGIDISKKVFYTASIFGGRYSKARLIKEASKIIGFDASRSFLFDDDPKNIGEVLAEDIGAYLVEHGYNAEDAKVYASGFPLNFRKIPVAGVLGEVERLLEGRLERPINDSSL